MKTSLLVASLLGALLASGQVASDSATRLKPQFKLSINHNTGLTYYGRTDSLRSSAFFPLAEIWLTPNFYVSAAPIFVNNTVQQLDYAGTVTTIGHQQYTQKKLLNVYLSKPFYEASSELVQSALKAQAGLNYSFLNRFVNLNLGGDLKLSNRLDAGASVGLDRVFRRQNKDSSVLVIDPGVTVYAGTQNFQRSYQQKRNSGFLLFPGNNQTVTENVSRFSVLAIEASVPIVYVKKKWTLAVTPAFIVPQNLLSVAGRPDQSEQGQNTFYATLTTKYSF